MKIHSLSKSTTQEIVACFNEAFAEYFVPIKLTEDLMLQKITTEDIDLGLSVGAYIDEHLSGFILIGTRMIEGKKVFYNAGTGVIPSARSQSITSQLYQQLIPHLKSLDYDYGVLEVIVENAPAIHVYKKMGYTIERELHSYKGIPHIESPSQLNFETKDFHPNDIIKESWSHFPTWQNSEQSLSNDQSNIASTIIHEGDDPIGYISYNKSNNRVRQFGVIKSKRNQGIASALFNQLPSEKPVTIINVDANDLASNAFLSKIGLENFLSQYEMKIVL